MQIALKAIACFALVAFAACTDAGFQGASGGKGDKKDQDACKKSSGETSKTIEVGEQVPVGEVSSNCSDVKKSESNDTDIATVGPDGTITGVKEGETDIVIVHEDGTETTVHVTVTKGDGQVDSDDGQDDGNVGEGDAGADDGGLGEEGEKGGGCRIKGDKIEWDWPKDIQDCFDDKKIWDFTSDKCTKMDEASSYDCDWDGIDGAIKGFDANFTPDWDKKRLKIISCGEKESSVGGGKKKTVAWQYVMLPKEAKDGKCDISIGAGIAIGCFSDTTLNLQSSDPEDLKSCLYD